ncbi:MAG: hypothetical protein HYW00_02460 [Candidatus Colwellbacteria bacterium]|nr:hypothetical protein [Candidatus Colwellbacteria bacterium]
MAKRKVAGMKRIHFLAPRRPTAAELAVIREDQGADAQIFSDPPDVRGRGDHELCMITVRGPLEHGEKVIIYAPTHGHSHHLSDVLNHLPRPRFQFHLPPRD